MSRVVARGAGAAARRARGAAARAALFEGAAAEPFMRAALREAAKGLGRTSPNPAVGAVLVKNGRVIARGHHARAGGPHAEVVALRAAGAARARRGPLHDARALRPLRPTPPCSVAVLEAGVRRVFVGSARPEPARERAGRRAAAARRRRGRDRGPARRVRRAQRATGSRSSPSGVRT